MSSENTPQASTEGVEETIPDTLITAESVEPKGPAPLYADDEKPEDTDAKAEDEPKVETEDESKLEADSKEKDADVDKKTMEFDSLDKPENSLLSDNDMAEILSIAKAEGLSKELAQRQVELANDVLVRSAQDVTHRHNELSEKWIEQCKADKEIGGEKFDESVSNASKAIKKFGTEELLKSLNETKFGNNPEVIRVFARIGRAMSSDEMIRPGNHPGSEKSLEEVFYGKQTN